MTLGNRAGMYGELELERTRARPSAGRELEDHRALWNPESNPAFWTCRSFFFLCLFRATIAACGGSQARASNQSYSCQPTPEPQQHRIWAVSETYTTAHGNARPLTQWARPGIEPATSWFLVEFVSPAPQGELPEPAVLHPRPSWGPTFLPTVCALPYVSFFL